MARRRLRTEDKLQALNALREADDAEAAIAPLGVALGDRNNLVVAKAARLIAQWQLRLFGDRLVTVFPQFMTDCVSRDPGCRAKIAIATTLNEFDHPDDRVFRAGIRHRQFEAAYGPPVDTATELRQQCALGMARLHHREAWYEITTLISDPEAAVRAAAANALARLGGRESELLLRLKAQFGDAEPEVTGHYLAALMAMAPSQSFAFVAEFLKDADEAIVQEAAIAIAESRHPEAARLLLRCFTESRRGDRKRALILPLALTRDPAAIALLIAEIETGSGELAVNAVRALAVYRSDEALAVKVRQAAAACEDPAAARTFQQAFGD